MKLFDISKDQIPATESNKFQLDLPTLGQTVHENTMQGAFSFLDYLENKELLQK